MGMHIASEEEVFDDMSMEDLARNDDSRPKVLDEEQGISTDEAAKHAPAPSPETSQTQEPL